MERVERLIEIVRDNPILYDTSHSDYMRTKMKDELWEKIGAELSSDGLCLIEAANTERDTAAISKDGGKTRYGLFQIDTDWCSEHFWPGKKCFVTCKAMVKDPWNKNSKCALKIWKENGFEGFPEWKENCEGKQFPDLKPCLTSEP